MNIKEGEVPVGIVITERDFNLLCQGFIMGFEISFEGWNGETFKEFQRPILESPIFRAKMEEAIMAFLLTGRTTGEKDVTIN